MSQKITARVITVLLVYFVISAALGAAFSMFPWTMLPIIWLTATALSSATLLFLPMAIMFRRPTLIQTASVIEAKSNIKHPALSLALELSRQNSIGGSQSLKELAYDRAAEQLELMRKVRFSFINKYVLASALILLIANAGILALSQNRMTDYWRLPIALITGDQARVEPGSITVPLNGSATLKLTGADFPTARLETWPLDGQNRNRHFLRPDSAGDFSFTVDNIRESFVYQFSLSSALSPETVTVALPPMLRSLQVSLTPPRYTRLPPRELPPGQGNITAYAGTKVDITVESGVLREAGIIINDKDTIPLETEGRTASGSFIVERSAEYTFFLIDTLGQLSDSLPRFMINAVPDERPVARIIRPGENRVLTAAQVETLFVEGIDNFGISRMELRFRRSGEPPNGPHENHDISERGSPPLIRKSVVWNIRELTLYPGDTLYYWLWVRDNKPAGRAQTAQSDTFWFRVPSFEEIHRAIVEREEYAQEKLGEVRRRQENISSAVDRLVRSATGSNELSWDQQRVIEDVKEQMQAQADSLQKAFEALEEGMERLREDGKLDGELFAKMEEIQKSIQELMKEFGEEFFKMDSDRPMTMNDMRQAASKLKDMLPELSERLDHTLAFLERIRQEKELADLALRAENLSGEQAELAESGSGQDAGDNRLNDRRQQDLLDRIDSFNSDVEDFFKGRQGQQTPSSSRQVGELSQQMREQSRSGDSDGGQCQLNQNAMSRELLSLSEQLKSNLSVNMMARMEEDRRRLLSMAHDAISLEEWQRLIRLQSLGTADNRGVALAQQALGNSLRLSLAKADSLTMVNAQILREIVRAYRNASEKSAAVIGTLARTDGARQMEQSVHALRDLAHVLLSITGDSDSDDGSGGGSGGMMSGLRRASGRQAALNSMMGDMLQAMFGGQRPMGQGRGQQQGGQGGEGQNGQQDGDGGNQPGGDSGGGGGEREREIRRQAREAQQAIVDELKRLADAYGREAGQNMEDRVRELEQEARRLAQLLENPPADIIDQQDRFLSRMLQSTLSLNRKDEGREERKGVVSQTPFTNVNIAPSAGMSSGADSFHLLRQRAFDDNFPEEYRSAVREYFDVLGEMSW